MVGCGYSGGKPRHWLMIREVVSLDMLVIRSPHVWEVGQRRYQRYEEWN